MSHKKHKNDDWRTNAEAAGKHMGMGMVKYPSGFCFPQMGIWGCYKTQESLKRAIDRKINGEKPRSRRTIFTH